MSNALVTVTFPDGHKLYTQYHGTSDTYYSALFDSPEEAWSHSRFTDEGSKELSRTQEPEHLEPVKIWNDYGGGSEEEAKACRKTKQLVVESYTECPICGVVHPEAELKYDEVVAQTVMLRLFHQECPEATDKYRAFREALKKLMGSLPKKES